jgi:Fe-S cluster biogenesis protein NfuA
MNEKVEEALDLIRPALQNDGGDIELVGVDEETGVVTVRFLGGCAGCPMRAMTLKSGVERVLKECVPEIQSVEAV